MKNFSFDGLFVFDMANNHQGDLEHGLEIIRQVGAVAKKHGIKGGLKFQFRQIDTFIHPAFVDRDDVKHIPRFVGTRLDHDAYRKMVAEVRAVGMVPICTPFDEESVEVIQEMGIDIIKIASCSATDRPLLEKIAADGRPVIASTAGLSLSQMDRLVSFFDHHNVDFALMHCVALYPTPNEKLRLNQITLLKDRYPEVTIGFSTHEDPDNYNAVRMAFAKGAKIMERHVGVQTDKYKLNGYSSRPDQLDKWIIAYKESVSACGGEAKAPAFVDEVASLNSLRRGVYAKQKIGKGETINRADVFFAMPYQGGGLASGDWNDGFIADKNYTLNSPLSGKIYQHETSDADIVYQIMLMVRGMLNNARIIIGKESSIEISHHYGLSRFREFGAVIIDCINREYCKKLLIQLPRQKHPYHYHAKKEETFQVLHGDIEFELDGARHSLKPGDTLVVEKGKWHKFHTLHGAIIEEVSTTHYNDDSFYEDKTIARLDRAERKTKIANWSAAVVDSP